MMMKAISRRNIFGEFNIVRYNPFSPEQGEETDRLDDIKKQISEYMPCKIIPRLDSRTKASCGMFVDSTTVYDPTIP